MLSGAFWINKPAELTSSDVVVRLKIALTKGGYCEKGFKIGHGGTLDPFATGTLVILVGEATKLADTYLHSIKSYTGIISLGTRTDTADFTGTVVETKESPRNFGDTEWQNLANSFCEDMYLQTPPMYSAKKQDGRPLHELARQGIEVERKAILKKIYQFDVKKISDSELSFEVKCESGTYVRVIAEDLANKAGTVAHLKTLIRTQTSDVTLEKCSSLESVQTILLEKAPIEKIAAFHPMQKVATHLPSIEVSSTEAQEFLQGYKNTVQAVTERYHSRTLRTSGARSTVNENNIPTKYFLARLANGSPIALFERTSENDSILKPTYRLQRVILWQS
jgi:tRNA pseudouridine55 synthase